MSNKPADKQRTYAGIYTGREADVIANQRIKYAQDIIKRATTLKEQLDDLYSDIKSQLSLGGWPKIREDAAHATNYLGQVIGDAADIIKEARKFRKNKDE